MIKVNGQARSMPSMVPKRSRRRLRAQVALEDGHGLNKTSRPAEVCVRMSDLLRGLEPGARMPSYQELKARLGAPQRSIDLAYERLEQEGAVTRRWGDGTYVLDPWAGGSFVCLLSSGYLQGDVGAYARLFCLAMEGLVHKRHAKTSTLILMTTERHYDTTERERQVRKRLSMFHQQLRLLGVFSTFALVQKATVSLLRDLDLPHVSIAQVDHPTSVLLPTPLDVMEQGLGHLIAEGWRDILVLGFNLAPAAISGILARVRAAHGLPPPRVRVHSIALDYTSLLNTELKWIGYIRELIRSNALPKALLITDDAVCRLMLLGASLEGVALAERCAIVTQSSKGLSLHATRELTRLEYDYDQIAAEALRMMESAFRGACEVQRRPVSITLRVGRSSRRGDYGNGQCHG